MKSGVVKSGDMGFGKFEFSWVALSGEAVDMRSAGVGQSHHLGAFVECLTGCVVDGLADDFHVIVVFDKDYL